MKILSILFLIFTAKEIMAQGNVNDALSRMEGMIRISEEEFTMRDKYFLGRTVAAHILNRYPIYTENPDTTRYLNMICMVLAINSPVPEWYNGYYVTILDEQTPNAFSTPGGHIFITRGLVELVTSEDMLAAIIAHELAHIQLEHGIAEIKNNRLIQDLFAESERIRNQQQIFIASVNQLVQTLLSGGYSQLQEFEADSMALMLLASAGYNPQSLVELLRIFERLQINQIGNLNNTHPLPAERIARIEQQSAVFRLTDTGFFRRNRFVHIMGN